LFDQQDWLRHLGGYNVGDVTESQSFAGDQACAENHQVTRAGGSGLQNGDGHVTTYTDGLSGNTSVLRLRCCHS
jgi:hypothetical protein